MNYIRSEKPAGTVMLWDNSVTWSQAKAFAQARYPEVQAWAWGVLKGTIVVETVTKLKLEGEA